MRNESKNNFVSNFYFLKYKKKIYEMRDYYNLWKN